MVTEKILDAVSLMATSRRSDLEHGARSFFRDGPLFRTPTRRHASKVISRTFTSPKAFVILAFMVCMYTLFSSHLAGGGPDSLDAFLPHGRSAFGLVDSAFLDSASTLVIYDYQGLDEEDMDNLRYFLAVGVSVGDGNRYLIVSQQQLSPTHIDADGVEIETEIDLPDDLWPLPPLVSLPSNVQIVMRPNEPCRSSWGVFGWIIDNGIIDISIFKSFVLVESSVRGPFLPAHWPPLVHWSTSLTTRLDGAVHMAGTTISTDPTQPGPAAPLAALPRPQPRLGSGLVAFDHVALEAIQKDPDALKCRATPEDARWFNEAGASAAVLHAGLNLDCLMLRFQNKDWLDKSSWGWKESNSDVDSGPFQVMFVPLRSKALSTSRAAVAAHQYSMWAIRAMRAAVGENEGAAKTASKTPAVKKPTATDTVTAQMQVDAAAAQAAAMALRQQRQIKADAEAIAHSQNTVGIHTTTEQQQQQQQQQLVHDGDGDDDERDDDNDDAGFDEDQIAADDTDDGGEDEGEYLDENNNSDDEYDPPELPPDVLNGGDDEGDDDEGDDDSSRSLELLDDYSGANDFNQEFAGGGMSEEEREQLLANEYHERHEEYAVNHFGGEEEDGGDQLLDDEENDEDGGDVAEER